MIWWEPPKAPIPIYRDKLGLPPQGEGSGFFLFMGTFG